ncbi:VWA domain-containing protein, partial [Paenibacillus albiflavus]
MNSVINRMFRTKHKTKSIMSRLLSVSLVIALIMPSTVLAATPTASPQTTKEILACDGCRAYEVTTTFTAEPQSGPTLNDIVIVLDNSASMEKDLKGQDIGSKDKITKSRKQITVENAQELVDKILAANKDNKVAVVKFDSSAQIISYEKKSNGKDGAAGFTSDSGQLKNAITTYNNAKTGNTNIDAGLQKANEVLSSARANAKKKVFLFTDGGLNMSVGTGDLTFHTTDAWKLTYENKKKAEVPGYSCGFLGCFSSDYPKLPFIKNTIKTADLTKSKSELFAFGMFGSTETNFSKMDIAQGFLVENVADANRVIMGNNDSEDAVKKIFDHFGELLVADDVEYKETFTDTVKQGFDFSEFKVNGVVSNDITVTNGQLNIKAKLDSNKKVTISYKLTAKHDYKGGSATLSSASYFEHNNKQYNTDITKTLSNVNAPLNVNAGPDVTVNKGQSVTLEATASGGSGSNNYKYEWKVEGGSEVLPTTAKITPDLSKYPVNSEIVYVVTVTDGTNNIKCSVTDKVKVTIQDTKTRNVSVKYLEEGTNEELLDPATMEDQEVGSNLTAPSIPGYTVTDESKNYIVTNSETQRHIF